MFSTCNVHNIRLGLPRIPPHTHSHLPCICPSSPPAGDLRGVLDCITEGHRAFAPSPPSLPAGDLRGVLEPRIRPSPTSLPAGDLRGVLDCITEGHSVHAAISMRNQQGQTVCGVRGAHGEGRGGDGGGAETQVWTGR